MVWHILNKSFKTKTVICGMLWIRVPHPVSHVSDCAGAGFGKCQWIFSFCLRRFQLFPTYFTPLKRAVRLKCLFLASIFTSFFHVANPCLKRPCIIGMKKFLWQAFFNFSLNMSLSKNNMTWHKNVSYKNFQQPYTNAQSQNFSSSFSKMLIWLKSLICPGKMPIFYVFSRFRD